MFGFQCASPFPVRSSFNVRANFPRQLLSLALSILLVFFTNLLLSKLSVHKAITPQSALDAARPASTNFDTSLTPGPVSRSNRLQSNAEELFYHPPQATALNGGERKIRFAITWVDMSNPPMMSFPCVNSPITNITQGRLS